MLENLRLRLDVISRTPFVFERKKANIEYERKDLEWFIENHEDDYKGAFAEGTLEAYLLDSMGFDIYVMIIDGSIRPLYPVVLMESKKERRYYYIKL
jgi:hypothetical protein